jgi:hypothetical protein
MLCLKRWLPILALFSLIASPVLADELLAFKGGYLKLNPDGEFSVSGGGVDGTPVDMDDDLGFDDSEDYFLEAALQLGSFRLFVAYLPISFSGDGVLTQNVEFNGETFVAGSQVDSDVDIDLYQAGLAWYLINLDDLPVRLQFGPELSVIYVNADLKMKEDVLGLNESESVGAAVPTIGLRGRLALGDYLGVTSRVGYLSYDGNSFLDVDAQVELSPLPLVGVFAGYRYLDIDVDESGVMIDATFDGPYAGALIRF